MIDICIAGLTVNIENDNPLLLQHSHKYNCQYSSNADITVKIESSYLEKEIAKEQKSGLRYSKTYSEYLAIYRMICTKILDFDCFLMHASVVCKDGEAYAFTAPSGTGKSTHARLWNEYLDGVSYVNDDKPIIRVLSGKIYACGTPWCGKHGLSENIQVPLKGICIIKRAKENSIRRVDPALEINSILSQTYRPTEYNYLVKTVDLLNEVLSKVPIYMLSCNISREAAILSYETMRGGKQAL